MTEEIKKLYRSKTKKMIAGICGGLENYFKVDATIFRVLFGILIVCGGAGILLYFFMWGVVPQETQ